LGAKVLGAISSNVDIVVHGDKAGKKLAKAKELGLRLMPEQEYLMLK
jgi:DNA ligase (NAD+)